MYNDIWSLASHNWILWAFLLLIGFLVLVRLPWVWWWNFAHRFYMLKLKDIDAAERKHRYQNESEHDEATWEQKRQHTKVVIYGLSGFICFVYCITVAAAVFNIRIDGKYEGIGAWGPVGDFFGGMLNPILAFASFIALLYTIRIQSEELRLTRLEFQKSVAAQKELVNSHDSSVKIQSETANLNRAIAEFEYLSSMLQSHSTACSFLLYDYSRQVRRGGKGDAVVINENLGLWHIYTTHLQALRTRYGPDAAIEGRDLRIEIKKVIDASNMSVNMDTLRKDMVLVGNLLSQLKNNKYFSSHADTFILEFRRAFLIVYVVFKLTDFAGYTFDPRDYLAEQNISFS